MTTPRRFSIRLTLMLSVGALAALAFTLRGSGRNTKQAFAHYKTDKHSWVADKGDYQIIVGASSRDIRLSGSTVRRATDSFPD